MSSNNKKSSKKTSKATGAMPSQQPIAKATPIPWHSGEPFGATGRKVGETAVSTIPAKGSMPEVQIKANRPRPALLEPIKAPEKQQPSTARFSFPGSSNQMAEVSGDPRLSDKTVATVASNMIARAYLDFSARKAKQNATKAEPTAGNFQELQSIAEKKRLRANEFSKGVEQNFAETVISKRAEVAKQATLSSLDLMSSAEQFKKMAKDTGDFKETLAEKFMQEKSGKFKKGSDQDKFIKRMEEMAPEMRGSMYFGAEAQDQILKSGGLFAMHTRKQLGMGNESKTTESDVKKLGNHDHVFFFLEHENTPMRPNSRFASESTESGHVETRTKGEDEAITSGSRRISFPLSSLMQQGTWAMKQDFLSPETSENMKQLPVNENFVATSERDPHKAARNFMRQMAVSALDMPGLKNKKTEVAELLVLDNQQLSERVFHQYLRPQLMVPSVVNLNARGAILDMPAQDAPKEK